LHGLGFEVSHYINACGDAQRGRIAAIPQDKMNRAHKLAVLIGAVFAVWIAIALRGQFLHKFIAVLSLTGSVFLFLAWICFRALRKRAPRIAAARHGCSWIGVVLLSISLSYVIGALVHYCDINRAQRFCEQIAESADSWREKHGRYPESLEYLVEDGLPVPFLLQRDDHFYVSDGDAFVLSFSDQSSMLDTAMIYTSEDRNWSSVPLDD
jgi:hypothetical protein